MQNIETEVRDMIAQIVEKDPAQIRPDAKFVEDLGMDSMMALEILAAIEKKYKITIPEEKMAEFKTLNDTISVVRQYIAQKEGQNA